MSTLTLEALATAVKFDADNMWVVLSDGRQLGVPLAYFPRLAKASAAQRKRYIVSGGAIGLDWDELDEDISVARCSPVGSIAQYRERNGSEKPLNLARTG